MSLSVSKGMLADAAKELATAWKVARRDWDDETARRFEEEYLEPITPRIRGSLAAMDALAAMMAKAERDLSDDTPS